MSSSTKVSNRYVRPIDLSFLFWLVKGICSDQRRIIMAIATALPAQPTQRTQETTPDKIPFDVPYGAPISLASAEVAINTAVAEAKKRDWKMNIAVVDSGGNLVA